MQKKKKKKKAHLCGFFFFELPRKKLHIFGFLCIVAIDLLCCLIPEFFGSRAGAN